METIKHDNKKLREVHILSADAIAVEETINQCMAKINYMTTQGMAEIPSDTDEMLRINRILSEAKLVESITWNLLNALKKLMEGIELMQQKSPSAGTTQAQSAEAD